MIYLNFVVQINIESKRLFWVLFVALYKGSVVYLIKNKEGGYYENIDRVI